MSAGIASEEKRSIDRRLTWPSDRMAGSLLPTCEAARPDKVELNCAESATP
jgi:hypothetical protein